ncbi:hypothetical protein DSO57_1030519 [Entomophthora muscae]|uniref:Uncharacterized protein n=1 Tax=Entomophthora muscae TaxID=34485 RepID=A0ACC2ULC3_9FUNG|nr:hypothetical protein DSO57_1030519 [Entomophthora muscae]
MALQDYQTGSHAKEIGAFSPISFQPPVALGSGVVWTGQNQSDFETYHIELQRSIKNYLKSKENEKDPRQPQVTIYDIKPMWLEAEEASEFYFNSIGRYVHLFPLQKDIHMITVPKYQSVKKVISLTDEVFPNNKGKSFAQLPAHFTLSLKEDKPQYAWVRLLAWNVKGYISNTFKKRSLSQLRKPNFNATILSVLPSGHLDAVAGLIGICTPNHLASVNHIIQFIQEHYHNKCHK